MGVYEKGISIPYGAIKRAAPAVANKATIPFQFLMVRLKDLIDKNYEIEVSIFQFLMVRLKELELYRNMLLKRNFNSLWCD